MTQKIPNLLTSCQYQFRISHYLSSFKPKPEVFNGTPFIRNLKNSELKKEPNLI